MFARTVSIRLKPNSVAESNRALENEIEVSSSTFHKIASHAVA